MQESLLRALQAEDRLAHDQNLVAWFYPILRNVLTDLHRRRTAQERSLERFAQELAIGATEEMETRETACACFRGLLPTLRPEYAEVLRLLDLDGEAPATVAQRLGINRNHLKVRLHRARRQLRKRLEQTCQICAQHGCLDCTCNPQS